MIEDVRLTPREDDTFIGEELGNAAVPYTLEIDFRVENIISWARTEIRWLGSASDGFVLDRGIGTTDFDEGFNTFKVESFIARPPYGATPTMDFSVQIMIAGYFDTVTFPIETLPVSLMEIHSVQGVSDAGDFSVGEAYLATGEGIRATWFGRNESITARLLTGGIIPENTVIMMMLSGGPDGIEEEYSIESEPGSEMPVIDFDLTSDIDREPGFYEFRWAVVVGNIIFAERVVHLTLSGQEGFNVPVVIDLPGSAQFVVPLPWTVTLESEPGLYATIVTSDGIICRLLGNTIDEPLKLELLADIFESNTANSGIPPDAMLLTTEESELEGIWVSIRRAWYGDEKIFVHDYWLYRVDDSEYQFLIATSVGDKDQASEAYFASDLIYSEIDFGL